jgi:ribosomal protein S12 methylthiotransferase accessory factor
MGVSGFDANLEHCGNVFRTAASLLGDASPMGDRAAQELLARLEYLDSGPDAIPHRSALLRTAANFQRIFAIDAPDAPNLAVLGGEVEPSRFGLGGGPTGSVSGTGPTFRRAFESCVGEGAEYVSQFATADDAVVALPESEALADASPELRGLVERLAPCRRNRHRGVCDWTIAARLDDGEPVYIPADFCFRRP